MFNIHFIFDRCCVLYFLFIFYIHIFYLIILWSWFRKIIATVSSKCSKNGPEKWSGKWSKKWSGKCSPDFEGEFIEMFPIDRLSIFDGFRSIPRHFFFDVSEKMFDRLFLRNFSRWSLSSNPFFHSSHLGSILTDFRFLVNFQNLPINRLQPIPIYRRYGCGPKRLWEV